MGWAARAVRLLPLAALLLAGACIEDGPEELSPEEEQACVARGGYVAVAGFSAAEFCAEPTPDAGRMCSRSSDCSTICEAETRTCATHYNQFGCYSFLDDTGQVVSICVD